MTSVDARGCCTAPTPTVPALAGGSTGSSRRSSPARWRLRYHTHAKPPSMRVGNGVATSARARHRSNEWMPTRRLGAWSARWEDIGFAPEAVTRGRHRQVLLHRCPFREVAQEHPEVICSDPSGAHERTSGRTRRTTGGEPARSLRRAVAMRGQPFPQQPYGPRDRTDRAALRSRRRRVPTNRLDVLCRATTAQRTVNNPWHRFWAGADNWRITPST